jgi:hypothetical protein
VLRHVLRTRVGESYAELSSLRFEKRTQFDPTTPIFDPKQQDPEPHELLTAIWESSPVSPSIEFEVPKGTIQDVLLWTVNDQTPQPKLKPRWLVLIAGDRSPPIAVPAVRGTWSWMWTVAAVGASAIFYAGYRWKRFSLPG